MPFIPYQKPTELYHRNQPSEPIVKMRRGDPNGTTVTLNKPLIDSLKWIAGDRVEIMIGTGADEGIIAIRRAPEGYRLVTDGTNNRLKVSTRGLFRGGPLSSIACRYSVRDNVLYIEVPKAFTAPQAINSMGAAFNINAMVAA